jgi:hypothetical protein
MNTALVALYHNLLYLIAALPEKGGGEHAEDKSHTEAGFLPK